MLENKEKLKELFLESNVHSDSVLYKLNKTDTIRFRVGSSLLGSSARLFCNYPTNTQNKYNRETFYECAWSYTSGADKTSYFTDLRVVLPGSYVFYYTDSDEEKPPPSSAVGSGFFLVEPCLRVGDGLLPLDSIVCQTVLSKLLGPLDLWKERLVVAGECGYNMIHFTPIQALGVSKSAYSLCDQHALNPDFSPPGQQATFKQVEGILDWLRAEQGILSICDIVLNHTANETLWLVDHPSASYNLVNSPHLRPAFLLDRAIVRLGLDIGEGRWIDRGVPKGVVETSEELNVCNQILVDHYIPQLRLEELFTVDVEATVAEFNKALDSAPIDPSDNWEHLKIIQDPEYRRTSSGVDMSLALKLFNQTKPNTNSEQDRRAECSKALRDTLEFLNKAKIEEVQTHVRAGVENVFRGAAYERLDPTGPLKKECGGGYEFVAPYFTCPDGLNLCEEMELIHKPQGSLCMAHNGWVMGYDPLRNFALPGSNVYLRRELVAWGDSVKLRYGEAPVDSPFLWEYMKQYTVQTARLFDGIRLDNCHSTPLNVACYMLDAAREVRPDLYVVAELFTGSEDKDNIFVNNLGITSLIREGLSAWNSHELGRLVYKYGGKPVGAFSSAGGRTERLTGQVAHALFLDWTHDNPSPAEKRTLEDMLPSAGLVSMASCATGSNRGYDELVPHHIHVVRESRSYSNLARLDLDSGLLRARKELSALHIRLAEEGYTEVFVDQLSKDMVAVTRHCPSTRDSVIMVAHTRFNHEANECHHGTMLEVEGELGSVLLEAKMVKEEHNPIFIKHDIFINGCVHWRAEVQSGKSDMIKVHQENGKMKVDLSCLISGSFVVVSVKPVKVHRDALTSFENLDFGVLETIVEGLGLPDLQFALYQCDQEGQENGFGCYSVPGFGSLNYCGLAGLFPLLNKIGEQNDLGHPLAENLRNGDWLMDFIVNRLVSRPGTLSLGKWLQSGFRHIGNLPRYLIPRYFHNLVTRVYTKLDSRSFAEMSPFVSKGSLLVEALARGSVIHLAALASAPLPPLSDLLEPPALNPAPTLAAGLPHFSTGYMRSWGRDTFISLRGLLLTTGQFGAARDIILGYAACLRHGLIPNLLDGGLNARFNCRDAVWWWLRAILDYIELKEDGHLILKAPVLRLFPSDQQSQPRPRTVQPLEDVVAEALHKHWQGLHFREWNAGSKIDEHMKDAGFNNCIGTDRATGFVFGGNSSNCGTWMDKMGSSIPAGNKGVPSTPRDGSAVEIVGLSYSCIQALSTLAAYPHQTVKAQPDKDNQGKDDITLAAWADRVKANFERYFWIGSAAGAEVEPRPDLVNCVKIYKDTLNSSTPFTDYQLRPNFVIALAVAPGLVTAQLAWSALTTVATRLLGPLGMATLDSEDWAYRGDYDNSNRSNDPTVADGANYHQGPEWVWPVGFYLRALVKIGARLGPDRLAEAKTIVFRVMSQHYRHLNNSAWLGLPELTNSKGQFCADSNPIQAWSHSTLLDTLYDLENKLY